MSFLLWHERKTFSQIVAVLSLVATLSLVGENRSLFIPFERSDLRSYILKRIVAGCALRSTPRVQSRPSRLSRKQGFQRRRAKHSKTGQRNLASSWIVSRSAWNGLHAQLHVSSTPSASLKLETKCAMEMLLCSGFQLRPFSSSALQ